MDIFVIGGGAAGLSAAISATRNGAQVTVLEAGKKPASKILMTGGGRCNFTNMNISCKSYYASEDDSFLKPFLYKFDAGDSLNFFESIGVLPIIRDGYVYPINEEAKNVSDSLIFECEKLGVIIRNNTSVIDIKKNEDKFEIIVEGFSYQADKVIIASGGLAMSNTNYAQNMYEISMKLGHSLVLPTPSLVSLSLDNFNISGVRVNAKVSIGEFSEIGEINFTKDGVSGIPIMNISRHFSKENNVITFDFLPELNDEDFKIMLDKGIKLNQLLPEKLANEIEISHKSPKIFNANILKLNDFYHAQVTRGGVKRDEINPKTMESTICSGLYFAGEIIDVDGRCGGYNLHFAWGSGVIAGTSASGAIYNHVMPTIEQLRRWERAEIGSRRNSNHE